MSGVRFALTAVAAVALLAVGACADDAAPPSVETSAHALAWFEVPDTCHWVCNPCPPGMTCTQVCWEIGSCDVACGELRVCQDDHFWSETDCACIPKAVGTPCGTTGWCSVNEVCCNASCGGCAPLDNPVCTQQYCGPAGINLREVAPEACGDIVCPAGTSCCNASCNTCAPKGGACTKQVCEYPEVRELFQTPAVP